MARMRIALGILVIALAAAWMVSKAMDLPGYRNMSVAELTAALKSKDFLLVNVHVPDEGGLAGTDLAFPYDQVVANLNRLPSNKDTRIVLYCMTGRMSRIAAESLAQRGYRSVYNLEGGMVAWRGAGNPLLPRGVNR